LRDHGQDRGYHHLQVGLNSRLDSLQAAVLLAKLEVLPEELTKRRQAIEFYKKYLPEGISAPVIVEGNETAMAQFTVQVDDRPAVQSKLKELGVPTAVHYPAVICDQPAYGDNCRIAGEIANAKYLAQHVVSLPMHPYITEGEVAEVCKALAAAVLE
jgi:UDP-2-acetamido-2-deoxy-ribo-hexuluronate aminotransferase